MTTPAKLTWHRIPPGKGFGALAWYRRWIRAQAFGGPPAAVPCGDCNLCCRTYVNILITPHDRIPDEDTEQRDGMTVLRRHADGSCIYLVDDKCSIYHHRPRSCRAYDCREILVTGHCGENEHHLATAALERFGAPLTKEPEDWTFQLAVKLMVLDALKRGVEPTSAFRAESWKSYLPIVTRPGFQQAIEKAAQQLRDVL